ncbi:MAG: response regulator [Pyrinomonadaceae bacterium]
MPPSSKRILCLEDNIDDQGLIRFMLQQINADYDVIILEDAVTAINLIASETFDLFILDYGIAGSSGIEVCRWIRERDSDTPIMFFTGMTEREDRKTAIEAGANAYLIKPSNIEKFRDRVESLLKFGVKY